MIEAYEAGTAPPFELYALGLEHKHLPEIAAHAGLAREPLFVPSVGNFRQGMLVSIPLWLDALPGRPEAAALREALARHYAGSRHVRLPAAPDGARLDATTLNGSDDMELFVFAKEADASSRARRAARQSRQGRLGRRSPESRADARGRLRSEIGL